MSGQQTSSDGIRFFGAMGILFIGLKLAGYINWSWWFVTMPLWGGLAVIVVLLIALGILTLLE